MTITTDQTNQAQTMARITDHEAEFWTNISPVSKNALDDPSETSKDLSSDVILPDGLYFKAENQLNSEIEDHLSLLYKRGIEKQAKEVEKQVDNRPISEIFEFDDNLQPIENLPGINMSFLDRLFHQLTRPSASGLDYYSDEEFTEIDETEITAIINNNADDDTSSNSKINSTDKNSIINKVRSFIDELSEEKDVISGTLDEDTFLNRQSRRAKSSISTIENKTTFDHQTSF